MDLETVDIKFNKYIIIAVRTESPSFIQKRFNSQTSSFGIILIAFIVTSLHKINLKNCQLVKTVIQEQVSNGIYLFFNIFFYANLEELIAHKRKYVISYIGYILLYFKLVTLILQLGLSLLYLQTMLVAYGINVFKWFGSMAVGIVSWTVPMILVTIYGGERGNSFHLI
ncbi:hypothetical protein CRE_07283 [Caenorhabditis remanei]|uniref:Uncharacterized protein n=1 Tax=Caenorhabditis remanei TaxID=31234 RepID=E3M2Q1_CAERE|nr:hypothetical protein CRE_07283 [Caenorhabditis remanei]